MASQQQHALMFRIMRLARPSLSQEDPLRFMDADFLADVPAAASPQLASSLPASYPFAGRLQLEQGAMGLSGLLALPQAFGLVYLGEAFQAYVTVCNYSDQPVSNVSVKVELQTDASKAVLYDNTPSPLPLLAPGQRHDFMIKHDIKELGPHTLACSSLYTGPGGERQYLPQHFRFSSANPLVVRTRHRLVGGDVFLEATLENVTKGPIVMELVSFQPSSSYSATQVGLGVGPAAAGGSAAAAAAVVGGAGSEGGGEGGPLGTYLATAPIVPEGGSAAYLFRLSKLTAAAAGGGGGGGVAAGAGVAGEGAQAGERHTAPTALGRLEIRWRGPMGQPARLQTQTITTPGAAQKELSLSLAGLPPTVVAERPFPVELSVENATSQLLGPLRITFDGAAAAAAGGGAAAAGGGDGRGAGSGLVPGGAAADGDRGDGGGLQGLVMDGPQSVILDSVPPQQAVTVIVQLVALTPGQHTLQGVLLAGERDGKQYDSLARHDVYVLPP